MASRREYIRRDRRSIGSSPSDDEDPDDRQNDDRQVTRLPTLRSMIVRANSDEADDEEQGDDGREPSPHPRPAFENLRNRVDEEETVKQTYSSLGNNSRRADSGNNNSGPAHGLSLSQRDSRVRNGKAFLTDDVRDNYRSRERERRDSDRDGGHDASNPDKNGGRRGVAAPRFRDSGHDRDRGAGQRRVSPSRSPPRSHRRGDVDDEGTLRSYGRKRAIDRSPNDDAEAEKYENDAKGKAKHRDGFQQREREGGRGSRDRGRHEEHNSRRDPSREVSRSSEDTRDAEGRIRSSPVAMGRGIRTGGNGVDWGKDRERDEFRHDVRGGRIEMDRTRDGGGRGGRGGRGGGGRGGDGRDAPVPELHSIHRATVHSIRAFGIFVRMDGYRNHGLVHLGQISHHEVTNRKDSDEQKVEAITSVVGEGEQVWVKIISVQHEEDGKVKVGCSLKLVSQGDGKDLDPNNLQLEKSQSKGPWQPPKKLELDAVYNVSCTRCGGHGHLKKECYSTGDKTYELLEEDADSEDDDGAGRSRAAAAASVVPKHLAPAVGPSSKPPSGPAGRGRAMVRPAWMTHGVGVGGDQEKVLGRHGAKARLELPDKVTSLEDALAILEMEKSEKRKRRSEKRNHRKHRKRDRKHVVGKEGHNKEKQHRKRHRSDDDHHHHHRSKKKSRL